MSQYEQSRTCGHCGYVESRTLTALDAAFEQRREWTTLCVQCGCHSHSSNVSAMPDLSEEILETWANDPSLTLLQQDEDLMMANAIALPLLTTFVQRSDIPNSKRSVLLSAICVLVYDNTPDGDDPDAELELDAGKSAVTFLKNHRELFSQIGDEHICEYIKEVVYPLIGIDPQNAT